MFELKFDTDNAAFEDNSQIGRILREVANHIDGGCLSNTIRDINGNVVGRFYRTDETIKEHEKSLMEKTVAAAGDAIDAYYDGAKDGTFEGSVRALLQA